MLQKLPQEIIELISSHISQQNALELSTTCKAMHSMMLPRIYSHITIDSSPKNYSNVIIPDNINGCTTYVRSIYSLKKLLTLLSKSTKLCSMIQIIKSATNTPDISDLELNIYLQRLVPFLINLKQLHWMSENCKISANLISKIPNPQFLRDLQGNFHYNENDEYNLTPIELNECLSESTVINFLPIIPQFEMSYLRCLTLLDIPRCQSLLHINLNKYPSLISLKISMKRLFIENATEEDYLGNLFQNANDNIKLELQSLEIENFIVKPCDVLVLARYLDLGKLQTLSIENSYETWFPPSRGIIRRSPPSETFLELLTPYLSSLKSLSIGLDNELHSNSYLIHSIENLLNNLQLLKINLKFSYRNLVVSDIQNSEYYDTLLVNLSHGIQKFHLLKEFKIDMNLADSNANGNLTNCISSQKLPKIFLNNLSKLTNLEILSIPIHESALNQLYQLAKFQNLKFFDLTLKTSAASAQRSCLVSSNYFKFPTASMCSGCPFSDSFISPNYQYINYSKDLYDMMPSLRFIRFSALLFYCNKNVELWENVSTKTVRSWLKMV